MTWTLCTSGSAIYKAGTHANSTVIASGSILLEFATGAEGFICASTNTDWVDNYSGLNARIKGILADVVSSKIAMDIVSYDNTGYLTREADTLMNKNNNIVNTGIRILTDKKNHTLLTP